MTKTIVLVMMENRSFDHLLGWMSLPPYGHSTSINGLSGQVLQPTNAIANPKYTNKARGQSWQPFFVSEDKAGLVDLPHGRKDMQTQMGGASGFGMDGFAQAYFDEHPQLPPGTIPETMAVYPPNLIPATSFLARAFCVCDQWHAAIPTDTHPNRLMSLAGITKIDHTNGKPPDHDDILLDWCERHNVRWRIYSDGFSFITALRPGFFLAHNHKFRDFDELANDFQNERDETFPQLIIVEPEYSDDPVVRHPCDDHPPNPKGPGERFLADAYRAVTSNPDRWKDVVMLVVYDEHGGYFDHVPPFKVTTRPPPGNIWVDKTPFTTSGPRVPAIIVSPWVKPGSSTNRRFDHTAILQFVADAFDGGKPYSAEVEARRKEGKIERIWDALAPAAVQDKPPVMPPIGPLPAVVLSAARPATTPGMEFFERGRAQLAAANADALVEHHPESLFHADEIAPSIARAAKKKAAKTAPKPKSAKGPTGKRKKNP